MRVGWLSDAPGYVGGAELTQAEFRAAASAAVEIVDCPPGAVDCDCDAYVAHNCVTYTLADFEPLTGRPVTKYWHDVGPHVHPAVWSWLRTNAVHICCSPQQRDYMKLDALIVPPPVDLARFRDAAVRVKGGRHGTCSVASWANAAKAPQKAVEWANGPGFLVTPGGVVDFYGAGPYAPTGSTPVPYDAMPDLLAGYRTFVFLPSALEPFGRTVAEAWAAGCEVVTNNLVGARWWIENDPDALDTAATDFWDLITTKVTA